MSEPRVDPAARPAWRGRLAGATGVAGLAAAGALVGRLPAPVVVPVMVVVLAGIDLASGVVAKSWAASDSAWLMAGGFAMYLVMFWLYGVTLRFGELSTITIGWVVLVTVGNIALDKFRYQVAFPASKWIAALATVALLVYLLVDAPD
jgi:hypothetical protein